MLVQSLEKKYRVEEYQSVGDLEDLPDAYLSRFSSDQGGKAFWPLASYLELNGVKAVNSLNSFLVSSNKHLTQLAFRDKNINQPDWAILEPGQEINLFGSSWQGKTISKPNSGGGGRDIIIFESFEEAAHFDFKEATILQPYIKNNALWRLIYSKNQGLITAYQKKTDQEISSLTRGAIRFYKKAPVELIDLAEEMADSIRITISGMDILETNNGFLALESNANFDFNQKEAKVFQALEKELIIAAKSK